MKSKILKLKINYFIIVRRGVGSVEGDTEACVATEGGVGTRGKIIRGTRHSKIGSVGAAGHCQRSRPPSGV